MAKRSNNQNKPAATPAPAASEPATTQAVAPINLTAATPEQIAEQASKIDKAWATHRSAGLAIVLAQAGVDALAPEASDDERANALLALDDANMALQAAEQEIRLLTGLAPDEALPVLMTRPATEAAADSSQTKAPEDDGATDTGNHGPDDSVTGDASSGSAGPGTGASNSTDGVGEQSPAASAPNTTPSEGQNGTGNLAGPATGAEGDNVLDRAPRSEAAAFSFDDYIEELLDAVDFCVEKGDIDFARKNLADARAQAAQMIENGQKLDAAMAAREVKLFRSVTVWPLSVLIYDGETRPIGVALDMDPDTAEQLFAMGVVTDEEPEDVIEGDAVDLGAL